jgi:hypothetical protein
VYFSYIIWSATGTSAAPKIIVEGIGGPGDTLLLFFHGGGTLLTSLASHKYFFTVVTCLADVNRPLIIFFISLAG